MHYKGILCEEGKIVQEEEAYEYALERCLRGSEADQQEFKDMLVNGTIPETGYKRRKCDAKAGI